jgi:spermidine/putrescine transport system permease protein
MTILVGIPILIMIVLSFSKTVGIDFTDIEFTLENLSKLKENIYILAIWNSLSLSAIATAFCLLIGYPVAYMITKLKAKYKWFVLVMVISPMWSNMLLRIIAWEQLFKPNSLLNSVGISLDILGTKTAIVIGMISIYLPFMIFPIYSVLEKMDKSLIEAAIDLGASQKEVFRKIILPLSKGGIISGIMMTFLPSATAFALPQRLGSGKILLIGNVIENLFKRVYNFNLGSLLSLLVVIIIFGSMRLSKREEGELII